MFQIISFCVGGKHYSDYSVLSSSRRIITQNGITEKPVEKSRGTSVL